MRMVSNEVNSDGKIVIETESKFLFFTKKRKFVAENNIAGGFYNWLELPNFKMVPDQLSFQLDSWNKI